MQKEKRDRREGSNVTTEAEIGVMWPQGKEYPEPPEAETQGWSPSRASGRNGALLTHDVKLLVSRTGRQCISAVCCCCFFNVFIFKKFWFIAGSSLLCVGFSSCGRGLLCCGAWKASHWAASLLAVEHRLEAHRLQHLWHMGLAAPLHVESSWTRGSNLCSLHWQSSYHWTTRKSLYSFKQTCSC